MRHVLLATVATAGLLVTPGAAAQTPPKTQRATVDATVKLTRVTKARAVGTVRFTGAVA